MRIAEDIVTIAELKSDAAGVARHLSETRRPMVVTQRGKPAMVLLMPAEYDRLVYAREIIAGVQAGIDEADAGDLIPHSAVIADVRTIVEQQFPDVAAARQKRG